MHSFILINAFSRLTPPAGTLAAEKYDVINFELLMFV